MAGAMTSPNHLVPKQDNACQEISTDHLQQPIAMAARVSLSRHPSRYQCGSGGARKVASDLGVADLGSVTKLQVTLQRLDGPDHNQAMKRLVEFDENRVVSLSTAMYST
jgi:hypothetical protein